MTLPKRRALCAALLRDGTVARLVPARGSVRYDLLVRGPRSETLTVGVYRVDRDGQPVGEARVVTLRVPAEPCPRMDAELRALLADADAYAVNR